MKIDNSSFERAKDFIYLGTTLTCQNSIQEEIKSRKECLLSFCAESFVFQFDIQKCKHYYIQNYNIAYCLYGCETWSMTLREERRLRVCGNRMLRKISGPKKDKVTREWRKLHNEELNDLYSSPNSVRVIKLRTIRWMAHVACMCEIRGVYGVLVGKPEGMRPLGRPGRRWEDNWLTETIYFMLVYKRLQKLDFFKLRNSDSCSAGLM